jgi:hypothetical protein
MHAGTVEPTKGFAMRNAIAVFLMLAAGFSNGQALAADNAIAEDVSALRLTSFPKTVELRQGEFPVGHKLVLEAPVAYAKLWGCQIGEELQLAGFAMPEVRAALGNAQCLRLSAKPAGVLSMPSFRTDATTQDYVLEVQPDIPAGN